MGEGGNFKMQPKIVVILVLRTTEHVGFSLILQKLTSTLYACYCPLWLSKAEYFLNHTTFTEGNSIQEKIILHQRFRFLSSSG